MSESILCSRPLTLNQLRGHPTVRLMPSRPGTCRQRCAGAHSRQLSRGPCPRLSPALCLAMSRWWAEISHHGRIYTMAFNKCYPSGLCREPVDKHVSAHSCSIRCFCLLCYSHLPSWLFLAHVRKLSARGLGTGSSVCLESSLPT